MKTRKLFSKLAGLIIITSIFITSCEKSENDDLFNAISESEIEMAEDDALADAIYEDLEMTVDQEIAELDRNAYEELNLKSTSDEVCRVITVDHPDSTRFPKIITIDYGDGCTTIFNGDTITKKGMIQVTVTGRYWVEGSKRIITLIDYYVNDIKVEGTRTITNLGLNESDNFEFSIVLEDGALIINDTITITRESDRTREHYVGNRFDWGDDEFIITGEVYGVNARGYEYRREIISPLHKTSCRFFVTGIIESTVGDNEPLQLDYGDGLCDDNATLSRGGESKEIHLRFQYRNRWKRVAGGQ